MNWVSKQMTHMSGMDVNSCILPSLYRWEIIVNCELKAGIARKEVRAFLLTVNI